MRALGWGKPALMNTHGTARGQSPRTPPGGNFQIADENEAAGAADAARGVFTGEYQCLDALASIDRWR